MSGKREALAEDALSGFIGITPLARGAFRCCLLPLDREPLKFSGYPKKRSEPISE